MKKKQLAWFLLKAPGFNEFSRAPRNSFLWGDIYFNFYFDNCS